MQYNSQIMVAYIYCIHIFFQKNFMVLLFVTSFKELKSVPGIYERVVDKLITKVV